MSDSAPPPDTSSTNESVGGPPPSPPTPAVEASPPENSESPPPPISTPPPPSSSTLQPPSSQNEANAPPPDQSPPPPPLDSSSTLSPPPHIAPPPPSPPSNTPPSSSKPPPSPPSTPTINVASPPSSSKPPHSPPSTPTINVASPPPSPTSDSGQLPPPPPSMILPPPLAPIVSSPVTPSPPVEAPPAPVLLSPVLAPPGSSSPINSLAPPTLPESSTFNPLPTPVTPENPSASSPPNRRPADHAPSLTPPRHSSSSSSTPSSSAQSSNDSSDSNGSFRHGALVGVALAGVVVVLIAVFFIVLRKKKRRLESLSVYKPPNSFSVKSDGYYYRQANPFRTSSQFDTQFGSKAPSFPSGTYGSHGDRLSYSGPPESVGLGNSKSYFTFEEITEMTHGFSRQNLLGEGGFGCVYKGWLTDGRVVAVKQLKAGSGQGEREFRAEVEIISRVHHRHLVSLVGYCISEHHRSLVYEFVPNQTLEHHLHGRGLPMMDWPKRLKIAIGSARGLAYLHEDCHPRIIHRDIKTANILLDDSFEAQVADFGLAKLSNDTNTHVSTRVMGTFGYMAPEYASSGKLTDRSDVFSFGVVLLELITGRKPVDQSQPLGEESLVEWARPLLNRALETGNFEELVDPRLENNYVKSEMSRMMEAAAACVRHSSTKRPRMVQVLRALDTEGDSPDLSNGVKFGQSTVFDSNQYSADIQQFRRMAFGSETFSSDRSYTEEFDSSSTGKSSEYNSKESAYRPLNSGRQNSGEYQSNHEFVAQSMNRRASDRGSNGSHRYNGRGPR